MSSMCCRFISTEYVGRSADCGMSSCEHMPNIVCTGRGRGVSTSRVRGDERSHHSASSMGTYFRKGDGDKRL